MSELQKFIGRKLHHARILHQLTVEQVVDRVKALTLSPSLIEGIEKVKSIYP